MPSKADVGATSEAAEQNIERTTRLDWQRHTYGSGETANLGYGLRVSVTYESAHRLAAGEPPYNIVVFGVRRPTFAHEDDNRNARVTLPYWFIERLQKSQ